LDLDYPRKDGSTLRAHYQSFCEQTGVWDPRLDPPHIPEEVNYLWEWFWDIVGGKGTEEGFWSCLRAWSEMTTFRPTMWEVETLRSLHGEYQKVMSVKMRER
jgi:hypothetical protein